MDPGLKQIVLKVDHLDAESIMEAIAERWTWGVLPDACHDDVNMEGRIIAEICRGWMEMLGKPRIPEERQ